MQGCFPHHWFECCNSLAVFLQMCSGCSALPLCEYLYLLSYGYFEAFQRSRLLFELPESVHCLFCRSPSYTEMCIKMSTLQSSTFCFCRILCFLLNSKPPIVCHVPNCIAVTLATQYFPVIYSNFCELQLLTTNSEVCS